MYCFESCLFLFVLLADFDLITGLRPPTVPGVSSEKLRVQGPDGLRIFGVCVCVSM